jgi:PAS domain S-box-containing protein
MEQVLKNKLAIIEKNRFISIVFIIISVISIGVLDFLLPPEFQMVILYLVAIFLTIFLDNKNNVFLIGFFSTSLILINSILHQNNFSWSNWMLGRFFSVIIIWVVIFFVIKFIDIRKRDQAQEEKFFALFYYSTNAILVSNVKGEITLVNPAFCKLFGYEVKEIKGKTIEILIPEGLRKKHESHRDRFLKSPNPRQMGSGLDLYGQKKNGTKIPLEIALSSFLVEGKRNTIAFIIDNSKRRENEDNINRQKQDLLELSERLKILNENLEDKVYQRTLELEESKLELTNSLIKEKELGELKSRFVSMASHEFRTPLTSILSSTTLIKKYLEKQDYENVTKHAERIKSSTNNMNSILSEFLSVGKLEEGKMKLDFKEFNLNQLILGLVDEFSLLLKDQQKIMIDFQGKEIINSDSSVIKNVLINLVSNAIKYSSLKGEIWIKATVESKDIFSISIVDQGIGIPKEEQKYLFQRFLRASNAENIEGTGLGLYIVKRYVDILGGRIEFQSEINEGSTFSIIFDKNHSVE